jgi:hypothetical protein
LFKESRPHLQFSQSCIDWLPGAIVQELKRSEHEANRSLAYSAGVENEWLYTFMPAYAFTCTNSLTFTFKKPRYLTLICERFKTISVNCVATFLLRQVRGNLKAPHYR